MTDTANAAQLLRRLRESRGESLRGAAQRLHVAPSNLSRIERGQRPATKEFAKRAAEYYGVDGSAFELEAGRVPDDIVELLQRRPELIDELRMRFRTS